MPMDPFNNNNFFPLVSNSSSTFSSVSTLDYPIIGFCHFHLRHLQKNQESCIIQNPSLLPAFTVTPSDRIIRIITIHHCDPSLLDVIDHIRSGQQIFWWLGSIIYQVCFCESTASSISISIVSRPDLIPSSLQRCNHVTTETTDLQLCRQSHRPSSHVLFSHICITICRRYHTWIYTWDGGYHSRFAYISSFSPWTASAGRTHLRMSFQVVYSSIS